MKQARLMIEATMNGGPLGLSAVMTCVAEPLAKSAEVSEASEANVLSIDCPAALVGRVIGKSGETIRDLQTRSGARIQIDQDFPEGIPRKIKLEGSAAAVKSACALVKLVMENGPGGIEASVQTGAVSTVVEVRCSSLTAVRGATLTRWAPFGGGLLLGGGDHQCAKPFIGRVIGKSGETIAEIQQRTSTRLQARNPRVDAAAPSLVWSLRFHRPCAD